MTKLLIIGFDGMDYFMTKRTIEKYPFKNLKPILQKQVTKETVTGLSWASFYTGLDKKVHGVTDEWGRDIKGSNSFNDIEDCVFWKIIKQAGYEIYLDNLPITPDGFPFNSSKERDIVNWVYKPIEGGTKQWRNSIREMDFYEVISKVRVDSFNLIDVNEIEKKELIFIQFSFLDRIGHVFSFENEEIMIKSYNLAYELIDELFKLTNPQYLIVTSDHGFWKNSIHHHYANCAVAILNGNAYKYFIKNKIFKRFSINLSFKGVKCALSGLSFNEILRYLFHFNYVRQTDIFDVILQMFNTNHEKVEKRIPKIKGQKRTTHDDSAIKDRLERLGYI